MNCAEGEKRIHLARLGFIPGTAASAVLVGLSTRRLAAPGMVVGIGERRGYRRYQSEVPMLMPWRLPVARPNRRRPLTIFGYQVPPILAELWEEQRLGMPVQLQMVA